MPTPRTSRAFGLSLTWTVAGRGLYAAVQWLIVVVIAQLGGSTEVGTLALALAVVTPAMILSQLSLRVLKATDAGDRHRASDYVTLRLVATLLAALVCVAITLLADFSPATRQVLLWVILAKAIDNLSDVLYGFQLRLDQHDAMSVSLMARSALALGSVTVVYYSTRNLAYAIACQAFSWALVLLLYDVPKTAAMLRQETGGSWPGFLAWNPSGWVRLLGLGLPLGVSAFLASAITNVPRYFVELEFGTDSLGLFATMAYLATFLSLAANAAAQTVASRLGRAVNATDPDEFHRLLGRLRGVALAVTVVGLVGAILAGRPFVEIVYGEAFSAAAPLLPWVMVAGGLSFATTFASYGMVAARRAYSTLWSLLAAILVCLGACWMLVGRLGLVGAVLGWILGLATQLACFEYFLARFRAARRL